MKKAEQEARKRERNSQRLLAEVYSAFAHCLITIEHGAMCMV